MWKSNTHVIHNQDQTLILCPGNIGKKVLNVYKITANYIHYIVADYCRKPTYYYYKLYYYAFNTHII